jgi:hypothetical protein
MMGELESPTFGSPQVVSQRSPSVERRVCRWRQGTFWSTNANKAIEDANELLVRGGFLRQVRTESFLCMFFTVLTILLGLLWRISPPAAWTAGTGQIGETHRQAYALLR